MKNEIDSTWTELIQEKIRENNSLFLTIPQFELLIKDIVRHPQSPILNLKYKIECTRENCPFNTYGLGLEGDGKSDEHSVILKDNRDSLCTIMYWHKYANYNINGLNEILEQFFESFWKSSLRTPSTGMPDLKRANTVPLIANNTLQVYIHKNIICSVLFCDLDNFKNINEPFGHEYGDLVILKIGS